MNMFGNVTSGVDEEALESLNRKRLQSPKTIHLISVGPMECGSMVHDALLDEPNWRLTIATDFRQLLAIPEQESIQIAILDGTLSEFELEDASLFIRQQWPHARILLIRTGKDSVNHAWFDDCVTSIVAPEFLHSAIERLAAGRDESRSGNVAL